MNVLAIETTGRVCSVALLQDETILARSAIDCGLTHSQTLMPMIRALFETADIDKQTLTQIAVAKGPGSFTGLRIGAATAKALGLALDLPLVGVPTLQAMAMQCYGTDRLICPLMDARRAQVYAGGYRFVRTKETPADRPLQTVIAASPVAVEEFAGILNERGEEVVFLGDGATVHADALKELLIVPYAFASAHLNRQDAATVALLAAHAITDGSAAEGTGGIETVSICTADAFVPLYLRPAQAEREHVTIRRMEEKDVQSAHELEAASFSRPWTKEMLSQAAEDDDSVALVAVLESGAVVGTAFVKLVAGEGSVTNVNVDVNFRRQGLGRELLGMLLEEGRDAGADSFTLEVRAGNTAARKLYEACGFVFDGIRPGFYEAPKEDAAIYWLREPQTAGEG